MSLAKLTDEGLLNSLNPRLIQKALCSLAERENRLLIVPASCPAPSLTHVHRHKTLQWHTLFLSMVIHSHMHYPEASGSPVTVQTGHHPPLLFLLLSFHFFFLFALTLRPPLPPLPPQGADALSCLKAPASPLSLLSLLILLIQLFLNISHFVSAQSEKEEEDFTASHNIGYHVSY